MNTIEQSNEVYSENGIIYPSKVMLDLADLKKVYPTPKGDYVVLEDLNLQILKEEFVTIIGHSGCGKTTMLSMIAGLNPISGGNISVLGNPVKGPGPDRGVIFQSPSLMPWMTALQNVLLGVNQVFPQATKGQREDIAKYYLHKVGLENAFHKKASELSQGMQQRVGIARAFAIKPKVLLLDEPFAGVDPVAVEDIQRIVAQLTKKNIGILITDHNVQETLAITDRTYLMFEGSILKAGVPEELANDEMVRKVYLGQNFELRKKKIRE